MINEYEKNPFKGASTEAVLREQIASLTGVDQLNQKCELLVELTSLYFYAGRLMPALQAIEQLDLLVIEHSFSKYASYVYAIRAEIALLHKGWLNALEFCEQGLTLASKYKQAHHIAHFYQIQQHVALIQKNYEKAMLLGRIAIHFAKKQAESTQHVLPKIVLGFTLAYSGVNRREEAGQLLQNYTKKCSEGTDASLLLEMAVLLTKEQINHALLTKKLEQLWQLHYYTTVKLIAQFIVRKLPENSGNCARYTSYLDRFKFQEDLIEKLEILAYHDQLRAVQVTNGDDEKIGYHSGKSYRNLLKKKIAEAREDQFITIVAFWIQVDNPELLNRHVKVKYDYFMQIDQDFANLYPTSIRGKYYPTSFCAMFITEERPDMQAIAATCQHYLGRIELVLEGKRIHYSIRMGATSRQKGELTSLYDLYQEADQSLYYARVTDQYIVIYGGGEAD